jgi:hypothetical protein
MRMTERQWRMARARRRLQRNTYAILLIVATVAVVVTALVADARGMEAYAQVMMPTDAVSR